MKLIREVKYLKVLRFSFCHIPFMCHKNVMFYSNASLFFRQCFNRVGFWLSEVILSRNNIFNNRETYIIRSLHQYDYNLSSINMIIIFNVTGY